MYGRNMRDCCDSVNEPGRPHIYGCPHAERAINELLRCDCGTRTIFRRDGYAMCQRCQKRERDESVRRCGEYEPPFEMEKLVRLAHDNREGTIRCEDVVTAFSIDTERRAREARTRYDDYRALNPHRGKEKT